MNSKIVSAMAAFAAKHVTETFYAVGLNEGWLAFNSVEAFEKLRVRYASAWEAGREQLSVATLSAYQRSEATSAKASGASESLEEWVATENQLRAARAKLKVNPYSVKTSDEYRLLRQSPSGWEYATAIELGTLDGRALLKEIKDTPALLKGLKRSTDFEVIAPRP